MLNTETLKQLNFPQNIAITKHAKDRLVERGIKVDDIMKCIETGEIIKQYENDKPLPSCLIFGFTRLKEPIHIVVSNDEEFIYLITAYYPSPEQWMADFKTRKGD